MDQEIEMVRHDMALGVIPPDFALAKTLLQMNQLRAPAPEKSTLTDSLARRAEDKHLAGDYAGMAAKLVKDKVYPALDRQIALVKEMQKHMPCMTPGACAAAGRRGLFPRLAHRLGDHQPDAAGHSPDRPGRLLPIIPPSSMR